MRRNLIIIIFALIVAFCFVSNTTAGPPGFVQTGVSNLNTHKIFIESPEFLRENNGTYMLVAFIPTDSASRACIVGANWVEPANLASHIVCEYKFSTDGSNVEGDYIGGGVRVQVFFGDNYPGEDAYARLTLIQDGAIHYGDTLQAEIFW